jgi:hypothetical protein
MKKILETLKEKWAEYLLEILVIVIGILVAFGLNQWNEKKRAESEAKEERKEIVIALYNDLQVEIKNLDFLGEILRSNYEGAISLLEVLETKTSPNLDSTELFLIVDNLIKQDRVFRKQNTFDGLVSYGRLKALEDNHLATLLLDFYTGYDNNINGYNQNQNNNLGQLFVESFNSEDLRKIENLPTSSHTRIRLLEWFKNENFYKMIASAGAYAGAFNGWFFEVKTQAQVISEYMNENYSDILMDQE